MIRRPPRSTQGVSSAASDVYKRQGINAEYMGGVEELLEFASYNYGYERKTHPLYFLKRCRDSWNRILLNKNRAYCCMKFQVGPVFSGIVRFELFLDLAPQTCRNFLELCRGFETPKGDRFSYVSSEVHRIVPNAFIQAGSIHGGSSIYGGEFADESFAVPHDRAGILGMAKKGNRPHTNNTQFYITLAPLSFMDKKYVAFGRVIEGFRALKVMERIVLEKGSMEERCFIAGANVCEPKLIPPDSPNRIVKKKVLEAPPPLVEENLSSFLKIKYPKGVIYFYDCSLPRAKPENYFLNNFFASPFEINGIKYPTVEHFYQSEKFKGDPAAEEIRTKIINAETPLRCKEIAREHEKTFGTEEYWKVWHEEGKLNTMRDGIWAKFGQDPTLKEKLMATKEAYLVEDSPEDMYWGGLLPGSVNMLGNLLMEYRDAAYH
eukprot:TRINITY_DN10015_c0_g1_i5.p1 TRINITY_DN10015_c0_g1~~TRINITY_DN10015_c0_g1_i5.p1  ORF type:complete len:434 (-),score=69.53 TRINITY_DN10015_c0_g1_i5:36-1337(-)